MDDLLLALRVIVSLGVVVGLLWVVQRRLSRGRRPAQGTPVRLIGRQGVAGKSSVVVIEVEGERLVLGVTEQGMTVLARHDVAAEPNILPSQTEVTATPTAMITSLPRSPLMHAPAALPQSWAAIWQRAVGGAAQR